VSGRTHYDAAAFRREAGDRSNFCHDEDLDPRLNTRRS
jgi:hypothetical protein